jgi:hypothetical protein
LHQGMIRIMCAPMELVCSLRLIDFFSSSVHVRVCVQVRASAVYSHYCAKIASAYVCMLAMIRTGGGGASA